MTESPTAGPRYPRGSVLRGKYRVERVLGEGGMGVVLLATHLKLDQRVALKVLAPALEQRANVLARFAREARAVAKLRNEHVVRVLDVDETEDGLPFLVMELLVGSDLEALVRTEGPLSAETAADYVLQACEGIAEAHAVGIVHRDLKPANLFLAASDDGRAVVKILDFGIAKAQALDDLSLTAASGVVGSPLYMSPEQLKGTHEVDERTDVWSLGVVLYQLASGKLPFEATSATALAALIASEPPASLEAVRPGLPEAYLTAVDRCLRKDRTERFAGVVELAQALAVIAPGTTGAAERVLQVSRAATARRLSLAATAPELEEAASARSGETAPARVTAALTASDDSPPAAPAGQRTDYGSEVARQPAGPPARRSRRGLLLLAALALGGAALGFAMRGREPAARSVASGALLSSTEDALPRALVASRSAAAPSGSASGIVTPAEPPSASASARPSATAPLGRLPGPSGSARRPAGPRPSASASPFDIDLQ